MSRVRYFNIHGPILTRKVSLSVPHLRMRKSNWCRRSVSPTFARFDNCVVPIWPTGLLLLHSPLGDRSRWPQSDSRSVPPVGRRFVCCRSVCWWFVLLYISDVELTRRVLEIRYLLLLQMLLQQATELTDRVWAPANSPRVCSLSIGHPWVMAKSPAGKSVLCRLLAAGGV